MGMLIGLLSAVCGIASLVCWILVLIPTFKKDGPLLGIVGIITCGLFSFVWGWIKAKPYGVQTVMLIWTAAVVISIGIQIFFGASLMSSLR
jgi:hypothetical protein